MRNATKTGLAIVAAMAVSGCASPGYRNGDSASAAMRAASAESSSVQRHLDGAWKELDALVVMNEGDLRPHFDRFAAHVDQLQKAVEALRTRTNGMSSDTASYLSRWERELREVKNEETRRKSLQRRAEVQERVRKATEMSEQAWTKADACLADLNDVRRVLGTDLTQGGIVTVQDAVARAKASSAALRDQSVKLSAELDGIGKDIASPITATAAGPADATK